jgi:biopolymer transport protein ExbD
MKFQRRLQPMVDVSLVPMIDVVFQLVVFFMVSTTFILTPGIEIVLPESTTSEPQVMTRLVVTVASAQEIYLNKERYDLAGFQQTLEGLQDEQQEQVKSVVLEGDSDIPYSLLVEVLDILRQAGFRGINMRTRELE